MSAILPPVRRGYYLAHSVDLTHPLDYVNIKINDKTLKDEIYYDNKRDLQKIQNRNYSPVDTEKISLKKLSTIDIQSYDRRNMGYSKEMPFQTSVYGKEQDQPIRKHYLDNNHSKGI